MASHHFRALGHFAEGVAYSGAANPAVWLCALLPLVKWIPHLAFSLVIALMLAIAGFCQRRGAYNRAYAKEADQAFVAVKRCLDGYDVEEGDFRSILGDADMAADPHFQSARILGLAPKEDYRPFLTLKAFLQPSHSACGSVVLLPHPLESTVVQKFYVLHELGHSSSSGHVWHLSGAASQLPLVISYIAIGLMISGWLPLCLLTIVLLGHYCFSWKNEFLMEVDADWDAWKMYFRLYGSAETSEACRLVKYLFDLKARLADDAREFSPRADLAAAFGKAVSDKNEARMDRLLQLPTMSLVFMRAISILFGIAATGVGLWASQAGKPPFMLFIFALFIMWASIIWDFRLRDRLRHSSERLSNFLDLLLMEHAAKRLKRAEVDPLTV
ncbi:hypothetical protein SAMN05216337_1007103 [Bradyrhizobium brasilense]|uniref:Uncharacterized protein n=1 Tax=Bradyrhizobium brasilense TaxID=1419277 RepID=A0A1G6RTL3_9BRAD|nr:hypothetical protein [Bradyrhizobium brasilense]SDD07327.1 hypothetical protein SAMN05216337_1007103 [Bradyrhizobium brasilense]